MGLINIIIDSFETEVRKVVHFSNDYLKKVIERFLLLNRIVAEKQTVQRMIHKCNIPREAV